MRKTPIRDATPGNMRLYTSGIPLVRPRSMKMDPLFHHYPTGMPLLKWSINILIDSESVGPDRGSPNGSGRRIYCGDESTSDSKLKTWELVYPNLRILGSRVTSLTRKICHSNEDHIMLTLSFMYCIPRKIPPKTWTPERSWYDRTPETM